MIMTTISTMKTAVASLWQLLCLLFNYFFANAIDSPVDTEEACTVVKAMATSAQPTALCACLSDQPLNVNDYSSSSTTTQAKTASTGSAKSLKLSGIPIKKYPYQEKPANSNRRCGPRGCFGKAMDDGIRVSTPKEIPSFKAKQSAVPLDDDGIRVSGRVKTTKFHHPLRDDGIRVSGFTKKASAPMDDGIRVTPLKEAPVPTMDDGVRVSAYRSAPVSRTDDGIRVSVPAMAVEERSDSTTTLLGSRHAATTKRPLQSAFHTERSVPSFLGSTTTRERKDPLLVSEKQQQQKPIHRKKKAKVSNSLVEDAVTVDACLPPKEPTPETDCAWEGNDKPRCREPCRCCHGNFMYPVAAPAAAAEATVSSPPVQEAKAPEPVPVAPKPSSIPVVQQDKPPVLPDSRKASAAKKRNIHDDSSQQLEQPSAKKFRLAPIGECTLPSSRISSRQKTLVGRKRRLARSAQKMVPRGHFSIHNF